MLKEVTPKAFAGPTSFLARFTGQGKNYSTLVVWYLYSIFKDPRKLVGAIVLSLLSLAAQAAAIGVVYWYGRHMESGSVLSVPWLNIDVDLKEHAEWLWAIVIISTTCFVLSAGLLYLSRRAMLDQLQAHFARRIEELVLLSLNLPDPRVRLASTLFTDFGVSGLGVGARRGAIISMSFVTAITALIGGIGASVFLFWVDAPLTMLILVSVSLAALLLYPLTLRAMQSAKDREKAQFAFKDEIRKLNEKRSAGQLVTSIESADELSRAFIMRRRVLTEFVLAIEIGITIILGLVIYYLAREALAGREQWAMFIAYIAALRMTLAGVGQPIRAFGVVSRFYPNLVRYHLFIKDMQKLGDLQVARVQRGDTITLGTLRTGQDVRAEAGDCLALVSIDGSNEVKMALLGAATSSSPSPVETAFVDPANVASTEAGIAIIKSSKFEKDGEQLQTLLQGPLRDKVTLIAYERPEAAGAFGEKRVVTIFGGTLQRFGLLGSEEGDAALKQFSLKAADRRRRKGYVDADEEDEDDM